MTKCVQFAIGIDEFPRDSAGIALLMLLVLENGDGTGSNGEVVALGIQKHA